MSERTARDLEEARKAVCRGWSHGKAVRYENGVRCVCAGQAIAEAAGADDPNRARAAFMEAAGEDYRVLENWNDDPERTKRQVLAAFTRAIAAERRKAPRR